MSLKSFIKKHRLLIAILISVLIHILFFIYFPKLKLHKFKITLSSQIAFKIKELEENIKKLDANKNLTTKQKEEIKKEICELEKQKLIEEQKEEETKEKKYNTQIIFAPNAPIIKDRNEKKLIVAHKNKQNKEENLNRDTEENLIPIPEKEIIPKEEIAPKEAEFNSEAITKEETPQTKKEKLSESSEEIGQFGERNVEYKEETEKPDFKKIALGNLLKHKKDLSIKENFTKTNQTQNNQQASHSKLFFDKEPILAESNATVIPIDENDKDKIIMKLNGMSGIGRISEDGDTPAPMEVIQQRAKLMSYLNRIGKAFISSLQSYYHPQFQKDVIPSPISMRIKYNKMGILESFDKLLTCGNENIDKTITKAIKKSFPMFKIPNHLNINEMVLHIEIDATTFSIQILRI